MKKTLSIILVLCAVAVMWIVGYGFESYLYNQGNCKKCHEGHYELFDIERQGNDTILNRYFYKCDNCNNVINTYFSME